MANIPIYPGSSSFTTGSTPFGFYDTDTDFQTDADKVALFCARRLGWPITDVELQDVNFYTAFEEAVTTYGNEEYAFKIRDNFLSLEGATTASNLNTAIITPNQQGTIRIASQYGAEAGVGGNVTWYTGSVALTASQQDYDLADWAISQSITGGIEIKQIFNSPPPAIVRYFDPYSGTGIGFQGMLDAFGFGSYSPAVNFLLMPLNFDAQRIQAIEMNDQIRKSNYSFELVNNKLKIFPIPNQSGSLYFKYIKIDDRINNSIVDAPDKVNKTSNVPYNNPVYSQINSVGRKWIFEYTLALCKEMLGYIRGKYGTIPIPNDNVTLNSGDLLTDVRDEKSKLIERLRAMFDENSRKSQLERKSQESDFLNKELGNTPMPIYIG